MKRQFFAPLAISALLLGLAGCSSTIHDYARVGNLDTLSVDAKQRLVLVRDDPVTGGQMVCAEPSPDAIVAISAAFAAQGSGQQATGENVKAAIGGGSSESAASIAMRTASVQVLRDGYYRLCEARMNNAITPEDYEGVISEIGPFIATILAADAIGGMEQAPAVAISGGVATANVGGAGTKGVTGVGLQIDEIDAGDHPPDIQAKRIAEVLKLYLAHRQAVYFARTRGGTHIVR